MVSLVPHENVRQLQSQARSSVTLGRHYWDGAFPVQNDEDWDDKRLLWTGTPCDKLPWELAWQTRENGAWNFTLWKPRCANIWSGPCFPLFWVYISIHGMAGAYGLSIVNFLSSRNIVFHSTCMPLYLPTFYYLLAGWPPPEGPGDISCLFHIILQRTGSPLRIPSIMT